MRIEVAVYPNDGPLPEQYRRGAALLRAAAEEFEAEAETQNPSTEVELDDAGIVHVKVDVQSQR